MRRGFAIEAGDHGWAVVDDRGTSWAGFAPGNASGPFLAGFVHSLVEGAYAHGFEAGPGSSADRIALHRGRGDGLATWDIRVDGRRGACLARDGRHPLNPFPTRRVRLMLALARCAYDVALADGAEALSIAGEDDSMAA